MFASNRYARGICQFLALFVFIMGVFGLATLGRPIAQLVIIGIFFLIGLVLVVRGNVGYKIIGTLILLVSAVALSGDYLSRFYY